MITFLFVVGVFFKDYSPSVAGKLWLNEPDMTWRQEVPLPTSQESKIVLQTRLGLSPSKCILNLL